MSVTLDSIAHTSRHRTFSRKVGGACIDVNLAKGYTGINELKTLGTYKTHIEKHIEKHTEPSLPDAWFPEGRFAICPNLLSRHRHLYGKCPQLFPVQATIITQTGTLVIERMEIRPATDGDQYSCLTEVSNNVRVGIQVQVLGRRHVYTH